MNKEIIIKGAVKIRSFANEKNIVGFQPYPLVQCYCACPMHCPPAPRRR